MTKRDGDSEGLPLWKENAASPDEELEGLLSETVEDAIQREQRTFDEQAAPSPDRLVLFGAGGLGRRVVTGLRRVGVVPLAFADNNPELWGQEVEGVRILSPQEAVKRFGGEATFVVTIWHAGGTHRYAHARDQLRALGCARITSFQPLFWKYASEFLPYYSQDLPHRVLLQTSGVRAGFQLWSDPRSRHEYVAQLRWRLKADFDGLPPPVAGPAYFRPELFAPDEHEALVDCGAFDGDTVRSYLATTRGAFRHLLALEPDPINYARLLDFVGALPEDVGARIKALPIAAFSTVASVTMSASGTEASAISSSQGGQSIVVACQPLDVVIGADPVTFIKMDIEGAELDALEGARTTIVERAPVLAICIYHRQDHLWQIPNLIASMQPSYTFFLRPHNEEGWDLVCYAVPATRVPAQ